MSREYLDKMEIHLTPLLYHPRMHLGNQATCSTCVTVGTWICSVCVPLPLPRLQRHGPFLTTDDGPAYLRVGEVSLVASRVFLYQKAVEIMTHSVFSGANCR